MNSQIVSSSQSPLRISADGRRGNTALMRQLGPKPEQALVGSCSTKTWQPEPT